MRLVFGCDNEVAAWVCEKIGTPFYQPVSTIGWIGADNEPAGGCVFHNLDGHNIDIAIATARPVTRGVIRAICHYVFVQLDLDRITIRTRKSNKPACKGAHKLGFKFETTLEKWFGNEDGVQFKMLKSQCKWI